MWDVSTLPSAASITPCSQSLRPSPSGTSEQPHMSTVWKQDCFDLSLTWPPSCLFFFKLLSCFVLLWFLLWHWHKLCATESTLYLICYAVQRIKRNSSMTDPQQVLKTLHKLLTRPGTIYSQRNTKQDPVCLWHIVKIRSSRFLQLRKALMGSGNCSCVCQATLNQLFPPPHYFSGLAESRENTTHGNRNRNVWACLLGWRSVVTLQCLP